jgi:hypothetical protein
MERLAYARDLHARGLLRCDRFDDEDAGLAAYAAAEEAYRGWAGIEVVLLGSDSLETIRRTHGQYFETADTPDLPSLRRSLST